MKSEVKEAETSTPERPLWVWRVWGRGCLQAEGFTPTEEEARQCADRAAAHNDRGRERIAPRQGGAW
jgi:hypothetical protein